MIIRNELKSDTEVISDITREAFLTHPISNHTEQFIIAALRAAGALTLSLVAEIDGKVVGHIAFSPVEISNGTSGWYGLGPLSVLPAYQKRGIGTSLVRQGLAMLKSKSAKGCLLVGEPEYYGRFGFTSSHDLILENVPKEYFLSLPFDDTLIRGTVVFHTAFSSTS